MLSTSTKALCFIQCSRVLLLLHKHGAWPLYVCSMFQPCYPDNLEKTSFVRGFDSLKTCYQGCRLSSLAFFLNNHCASLCCAVENGWWISCVPYPSSTSTSGLRWWWPRRCHMDPRWVKITQYSNLSLSSINEGHNCTQFRRQPGLSGSISSKYWQEC